MKTGELFVFDQEDPAVAGTTHARSASLFHVLDGEKLIGQANRLSSVDQVLPIHQVTNRIPLGATVYQHLQFPVRFQNRLFVADWLNGQILSVQKTANGSQFTAQSDIFLTATGTHITDLTVGEDGALYFCTGRQGTSGGVYRVLWNGEIPESLLTFASGH